jgi:hypothetical protein
LQCYCSFYGVTGKNLQHQYKDFLSDFKIWNQKHTQNGLFPENIGKRLSIDETSLSNGTLYYFNQQSSQRKGAIVAMVAGTKAESNCYY